MTYSIIGILASIILIIINRDVLDAGKELSEVQRRYRRFLMAVLTYYITDLLWGFLDSAKLTALEFADTTVYFIAMAAAVLLWSQYVIAYLDDDSRFAKALHIVCWVLFVIQVLAVIVNCFAPIMFWFDEAGGYHAGAARYAVLTLQILMFLLASAYTLRKTVSSEGTAKIRHLAIGLFGIAMIALIVLQVFYPLMPFYAMGYLLGTCVLHSFVMEGEKEEYRRELEQAL
ncbi:MAG: hypothetical protein IKD70_00295, partial [Eggerthellaceae bacterium]|nr:hypothetical protein [Eggerthellaceae bacterium]